MRDKAVVLVTHQLSFLKSVDRLLFLEKGQSRFYGNFEGLKELDSSDGLLSFLKKESPIEDG